MARFFRLWEKKRGARRTGSPLMASVGEAMFSAGLLLVGTMSAAALITTQTLPQGSSVQLTGWSLGLATLLVTTLVVTGGGALVRTLLRVGTSIERRAALAKRAGDLELLADALGGDKSYPAIPRDTDYKNSPGITLRYRLPTNTVSAWRLVATTVFSLIWNILAMVLVVLALESHAPGNHPDWFLTWFAALFALAGLVAIYFLFHQLWKATVIGPTSMEISDHPLRPGQRYEIYVTQAGALQVRSMEVLLVCDEEATYQQGTDVRTERVRVWEQPVARREAFTIRPNVPFGYSAPLEIPTNMMHTFQAEHNAVQWKLLVRARFERWPPYEQSFSVIVYPVENGRL